MPMALRLGVKVGGIDWRRGDSFNGTAEARLGCKNGGGSWFAVSHNNVPMSRGDEWHRDPMASAASGSVKRKAAAALIAKIPLDLARHIGRVYYPRVA
jgi:hypothetical protein